MKRIVICCVGLWAAGVLQAQTSKNSAGAVDAKDQAAALAAIRDYAANYTNSLPNFTCTQVVHQVLTPARGGGPFAMTRAQARNDMVEEQLSFVDHREHHQLMKINGKPPEPNVDRSQPLSSWGEFGNLLSSVMDPATGAEFKLDRIAMLNGKKVYVFAYWITQAKGYGIVSDNRSMLAAYHGQVFADYDSKAVLRIHADIGPIADYQEMDLTLDYKPIQVAGQQFLLPSHYLLHVRKPEGEMSNESNYKDYKRFGTESTLIFDEPDPQ